MPKPLLFHDIDGVLFGFYGPDDVFQLRPGVSDWLNWAHENFEVVWLTSWEAEKIIMLLDVLYAKTAKPVAAQKFQCANWMNYAEKTVWLEYAIPRLKGREWFWIDDIIPKDLGQLDPERCVFVEPYGEYALVDLRTFLETKIFETKM